MPDAATLLMSEFVTHDVPRLLISKPEALAWEPGQGIEVRIDDDGWCDQARPFTPTSQPDDLVLELTLKRYPEHDGVTVALHGLEPGAQLLLGQGFGTTTYQGPGTFIAAGAGVTPFLASCDGLPPRTPWRATNCCSPTRRRRMSSAARSWSTISANAASWPSRRSPAKAGSVVASTSAFSIPTSATALNASVLADQAASGMPSRTI